MSLQTRVDIKVYVPLILQTPLKSILFNLMKIYNTGYELQLSVDWTTHIYLAPWE